MQLKQHKKELHFKIIAHPSNIIIDSARYLNNEYVSNIQDKNI